MEKQYGTTNNMKLGTRIPGRCEYLYVDIPSHRADTLFVRAEIPVGFRQKELVKEDENYIIVFCHFKKKYEQKFLECMADLERAMSLEGHEDYGDFCESLIGRLSKED